MPISFKPPQASTRRSRDKALIAFGAIALSILVFLVLRTAASAGRPFSPIAIPASFPAAEVGKVLESTGARDALSADSALVALSDFSAVRLVTLSQAVARVREGDPRSTPYLKALEESFYINDAAGDWQLIFVPRSGRPTVRGVAGAFAAMGIPALTEAEAGGAGGESGAVWLLPFAAAAFFILRKPRIDTAYKLALSATWLPMLATGGPLTGGHAAALPSALSALAVQAACHAAYSLFSPRRDGSGLLRPGRIRPRQALYGLLPFGISAGILSAIAPSCLAPLAVSIGLSVLVFSKGIGLAAIGRKRLFHEPPAFLPITRRAEVAPALAPKLAFMAASLAAIALALAIPSSRGLPAAAGNGLSLARETIPIEGSADPAGDHIAFQLALTYGRLGEAAWGSRAYTNALTPGARVDATEDPSFKKLAGNLAQLTDGSGIMAFRLSGNALSPAGGRLDLGKASFYLLSLAPVWGLILMGFFLASRDAADHGRVGPTYE